MIHKCLAVHKPTRTTIRRIGRTDTHEFWYVEYDGNMVLGDVDYCPWCGILLNVFAPAHNPATVDPDATGPVDPDEETILI